MVKILKSKLFIIFILLFVLAMTAAVQLRGLSTEITTKFDGKRWSLPAVVYARPLELYPGLVLTPEAFEYELQLSGYREEDNVAAAGGYNRAGSTFELVTRSFVFPSGREESRSLIVVINDNQVYEITDRLTTSEIAFVRLDPARIGSQCDQARGLDDRRRAGRGRLVAQSKRRCFADRGGGDDRL